MLTILLIAYVVCGVIAAARIAVRVWSDFKSPGPLAERLGLFLVPVIITFLFWPVYLAIAGGKLASEFIAKHELVP